MNGIILYQYKLIYFPIAKVASTSLKVKCAKMLDLVIPKPDKVHFDINFPLVDINSICQYKNYFKFAFVRNPWDRLVSCYKSKILNKNFTSERFKNGIQRNLEKKFGNLFYGEMPFGEFVDAVSVISDEESDIHFKSQYLSITDNGLNFIADFIGRFEKLREDFKLICDKNNLKNKNILHMNKTKRMDYRRYYNLKTKKLVKKRYKEDIDLFGYKF